MLKATQPLASSADALDPSAFDGFADRHLGEPVTAIVEIGNGNLNHVYRVSGATRSIIVKQALPYVRRIGASWPLTIRRLGIEARAYDVHAKVMPNALPTLLGYDEANHLLALEDLRGAVDWRTLLNEGTLAADAAAHAGEYCARIAAGTGSFLLSAAQTTALRTVFGDPAMQMFTERMAFTAPYREDPTNAWPAHLQETAARIRADETAQAAASRARWLFRTSGECLLHGDLHSGSVMGGPGVAARVIDLEFAFIGPIAFDLGNLLAHLLLARSRRMSAGGDLAEIDAAAHEFWAAFSTALRQATADAGYWNRRFERRLLAESALFAGIEILRRIGGRFHVADLESLDAEERVAAERLCINFWHRLVTASDVRAFDELWYLPITSTKEYL